jgi:hypothetical protein
VKGPCQLDIESIMDLEYYKKTDRLIEYLAKKEFWMDEDLIKQFEWCVALPAVSINDKGELIEVHHTSMRSLGGKVRVSCYPGVINLKGEKYFVSAWKYHILCEINQLVRKLPTASSIV